MTSKTSSSKPLIYTFFSGLKGPALAPAIINLLMFTLFTLIEPITHYFKDTSYTNEAGELVVTKATEMFKYFVLSSSDVSSILLLVCVFSTSIAAAVFSFNFITSKKTVNVYYSLGISRDRLYFGKYMSGAVLMVVSIAVPFLLAFVSNIIFLGYSKTLLMVTLFYVLSFSATALIVFSVTAAAFAAVGTFFEAAIFSTVILSFPTVIFMSLETFMRNFVHGTPYGNIFFYANSSLSSFYNTASEKLMWKFDFLNPLFFDYRTLSKWGAMDPSGVNDTLVIYYGDPEKLLWYPSLLKAICWILISVAIMFIGTFLFQKRKAEICGFIGTNKVLNTFATFTAGFFFLSTTISVSYNYLSTLPMLLIAFIVFAVIYIGLELVLLRDFKKFLRGLFKLPIEMAIAGAIIAVFITGLFGYSSKIPDASEIVKVAVTPAGISNEYGFSQNMGHSYLSNTTEDFSYTSATGLVDGFTSQKDIKLISELHEKLIKLGKVKSLDYFDDASTSVPDNERVLNVTFQFVYTLKNGKTLMRSYSAATPDIIKAFLDVENTDLFKQRLNTVFNEKLGAKMLDKTVDRANDSDILEYTKHMLRNEDNNISMLTQNGLSTLNLTFTMAEKAELARCLYMDLSKRTVEQKYFPKENPLGIINFNYENFFHSYEYGMDNGFTTPHISSESDTTTDESTTDVSSTEASDTSTSASQNQPLKITPLSASPIIDGQTDSTSEVTTTEQIESTTTTEGTTPIPNVNPVPETEIDEQQGDENTVILDKAVKIENQTSIQVIGRGPASGGSLQIVLTSDMENTIRFLKLKGLYDELLDKSTYASAQVVSVTRYNRYNIYYNYSDRYSSVDRLFSGSQMLEDKSSKGQDNYYYYFHSNFDYTNNFTTLSASELSELYKASRFVYYNNYETGYYIRLSTTDKTRKVTMFIPNSLMPASLKNKISQYESSNDYLDSNGMVRYY
ncbi:MAG TPA: ABC transporter permease [Clostridia bacterium]|nr:ABC transporter permease [Clostridia bacterium]